MARIVVHKTSVKRKRTVKLGGTKRTSNKKTRPCNVCRGLGYVYKA